MRRGLLLLPVALALTVGCSGGSSVSTQHLATTQQASPRQQADRDARELLTHVRVPPSSTTTRTAPTSRLDAPFEQPAESSLVDRHQLWRVGMTLGATAAWLRSHSPAGFTVSQSGTGGGPGFQVIQFAYEPMQRRTDGALRQLQVEVTNLGPSSSAMRADALAEWLDPRPMRDTADGRRMHVVVGAPCPTSARGFVGVTNTGRDLAKALLPGAAPTSGRICVYDGGNGRPPFRLAVDRHLTAQQAQRLASAARALRVSHPDGGVTSCPADDGAAAVVALSYPDGRDVDLWTSRNGCAFTSNGSIVVAGSLPGLR